jgi:hypothetical protein
MTYIKNLNRYINESIYNIVNDNLYFCINESESPFQVDSPLSAGGPGEDPNTRNIAAVETAGNSALNQFPPFDPNNKVWRVIGVGSSPPPSTGNNWASIINAIYQNWNNNQWWFDSQLADLVYLIYGDNYNWQNLPNGTFVITDEMKQNTWNCLKAMMQSGSQASSSQGAYAAATNALSAYQRSVGNNNGTNWSQGNFDPGLANYWFSGQGQQLTQFPPTPPWASPSGYVPFPGAPVYG